LLVIYVPVERSRSDEVMTAIGEGVAAARAAGIANKPVLVCTMTESTKGAPVPAGSELIPAVAFPENAVRALGKVAAYARWRREPLGLPWGFDDVHVDEARALCRGVVAARGDTWLTQEELLRVLDAFGLPMVPSPAARNEDEAAALAALIGFPVVMKVMSPEILHKTDAGAVVLDLTTEAAVRSAFRRLTAKAPAVLAPSSGSAIVLQPMIVSAVETIVGVTADPLFGPLVGFGLGGVAAEVLRDVGFRIAPLSDKDADDLIRSVRSFPLLAGHRGRPPADVTALRDLILRVSLMSVQLPEIRELDLNPVMALPAGHGCRIVDARIRVGG
jgi:acetate---CoA ligase (ADP-forming)